MLLTELGPDHIKATLNQLLNIKRLVVMKCGMHHLNIFVVPQCFGKEQNYILDLALHKAFTKRYEIF
jgi:hypothetical protein